MTSQCRNYMQQYSRTKSIREVHNKSRSSYKQLLQNSKTRENSITTAHLKLSTSNKKAASVEKGQFPTSSFGCVGVGEQGGNVSVYENGGSGAQPLLSSTQNVQNIINISYGKLNSKMKLKVTAEKNNIRSISSQEQLLKSQNSVAMASMANMGVGLSSQKKKPKLVTLTSGQNQASSTTKKNKNYNELTSISQHQNENQYENNSIFQYRLQVHDKSLSKSKQKSKQKSKSHTVSALHSKYSTSMAHEAAYCSIKKDIQTNGYPNGSNSNGNGNANRESLRRGGSRNSISNSGQKNIQIVTLNSSMLLTRDGLDVVYERVKNLLEAGQQKQKQWTIQRNYYQKRIQQLQKQLEIQKRTNQKQHPHLYSHSNYNSIIHEQPTPPTHKYSNRTVNNSILFNNNNNNFN